MSGIAALRCSAATPAQDDGGCNSRGRSRHCARRGQGRRIEIDREQHLSPWRLSRHCAASSATPWNSEPASEEVNIAFTLRNNLIFLPSATIDRKSGRFFFGTASQRTVLDPATVAAVGGPKPFYTFTASDRESMTLAARGAGAGQPGDALVGSDVVGKQSVATIYTPNSSHAEGRRADRVHDRLPLSRRTRPPTSAGLTKLRIAILNEEAQICLRRQKRANSSQGNLK